MVGPKMTDPTPAQAVAQQPGQFFIEHHPEFRELPFTLHWGVPNAAIAFANYTDRATAERVREMLMDLLDRAETRGRQVLQQDYEEVLADHRRLVRELDVLLNGDGAVKQASLCDLVAQMPSILHHARTAAVEACAKKALQHCEPTNAGDDDMACRACKIAADIRTLGTP